MRWGVVCAGPALLEEWGGAVLEHANVMAYVTSRSGQAPPLRCPDLQEKGRCDRAVRMDGDCDGAREMRRADRGRRGRRQLRRPFALRLPYSCLGKATCDQYSFGPMTTDPQDDAGITWQTCTAWSQACTCYITTELAQTERGTFALSGTAYSLASNDAPGTTGGGRYCVRGSTLYLFAPYSNRDGPPITVLTAVKQ
jgi:hypothetical protein